MKDIVLQTLHLVPGRLFLSPAFIYQPALLVTLLLALPPFLHFQTSGNDWFLLKNQLRPPIVVLVVVVHAHYSTY